MGEIFDLEDVTSEELDKLQAIQADVSKKYIGREKDLRTFVALKDELETRCAEAGFAVKVIPETTSQGNWVPVCSVVGRTERKEFDPERAARESAGGLVF